MATNQPKYSFSFTAASLRLNEMVAIARIATENNSMNYNAIIDEHKIFGGVKNVSSKRISSEVTKRLEELTDSQLSLLANGELNVQKQMAFLAACKRYDFIYDFVVEIVRDKTLMYNYQINESDFKAFMNSKINSHPELESYTEKTISKVKQVLFLILEQAGIINNIKTKIIVHQILTEEVISSILSDNPNHLRLFFFSDSDINKLR